MTPRGPSCGILLITRNLPPLRGGMERLNLHMATQLAAEFPLAVVGIAGCRQALPEGIEVFEVAGKPLWRFFLGALWRSVAAARRLKPGIVLAGSGLTAPFAWLGAKFAGAQLVVYVHGLDLVAAHPIYRWGWLPFIRRADLCIANSANTRRLAIAAGVSAQRIAIVHPGVELPPPENAPNDFRARFGLGDRPIMISVGRLVARKGLLEFVENALPEIVANVPAACLVVIGEELPQMLSGSSAGLGERIRARAEALGLASNVRFLGVQDDATLAAGYRAAEIHVFPVREVANDVEGFGMVAVEAAAHGLPTVAFAVGGVPDAVEEGVSGTLVEAGDYQAFARAVIAHLRHGGSAQARSSARRFAERFRWEAFGAKLRNLMGTAASAERG